MFALIQAGVSHAMINVNVVDYGAVPNDGLDDSAAFQAALDAIQAAGGGHLYIPAGGYGFDSVVTFNIVDSKRGLTIEGAGEHAVYLRSSAANPNGIFHITSTWRDPQIMFKDFQCVAHRANAGTAILVSCPYGGVQDRRIVACQNITVRSADSSSYYNKGFSITGLYRPIFTDCTFTGAVSSTDFSDTSSSFKATFGFDVTDSYGPVFWRCKASGAHTGFNLNTTNEPEGGGFFTCETDYCRVGIKWAITDSTEVGFHVDKSNIRARDIGVNLVGRRVFNMADNTFRQLSTAHALRDMYLQRVSEGCLLRNTFSGTLAGGRKNIYVSGDSKNLLLGHNTFSGSGAVVIASGAINIVTY